MRINKNTIFNIVFVFVIFAIILYSKRLLENTKTEIDCYNFTKLENDNEISALLADGHYMYVGTKDGVKVYDTNTLRLDYSIDDISLVYTASITKASDGTIFIGHDDGMIGLAKDGKRVDFTYPMIPNGRVNAIAEVGTQIWCGTYSGLAILEKSAEKWVTVRMMDKTDGLISDSVNVIYPITDGVLIGSYLDTDGGLSYLCDDEIQTFGVNDGLVHPYITSICNLDNETYYLGTGYMRDGGISEITIENKKIYFRNNYSLKDGIPGEKVRYIYKDENSLWITTEYDGILILSLESDRRFYLKEENGITDNETKCIAKSDNYYWLGGKYGLTLIPIDFIDEVIND